MDLINWSKVKLYNLQRRLFIYRFNSLVNNTITFELDSSPFLTISVLTSHGTFRMAMAQLKSLYRFLDTKFPLEIHDDGTLTDDDIHKLENSFRGVQIIKRATANAQIESYYQENGLVNLKTFRNKIINNLQFTDLSFFCKTKYCLQIDADILFFKKPYFLENAFLSELIDQNNNSAYYNIDRGPAYSYSNEDMRKIMSKEVPFQFNAGLFLYPVNKLVYKYAEDILKEHLPMPTNNRYVETQTIQCMAYHMLGECIPLDESFDVSLRLLETEKFNYNYGLLTSQHYCAWSRNLFYLDFMEKIYPFLKKDSSYKKYFFKLIKG